jgi:hypothetical protein
MNGGVKRRVQEQEEEEEGHSHTHTHTRINTRAERTDKRTVGRGSPKQAPLGSFK